LIYETADVLYHLLVLLAEKNIPYEAIEAELASREGVVSKTTDRPEITNL
jgi:phosphoribosyl-ATP diphosphatase